MGSVSYEHPMRNRDIASTSTDRERVLHLLVDTIDSTHGRINDFEAETTEEQELLIKWIRTLGYLSGQYRKLLKDSDLDELQEDVGLLETVAGLSEDD